MDIVNIAAYKFVGVPDRETLQPILLLRCNQLNLKGTILLADEGINFTLAGTEESIENFLSFLIKDELFTGRFADLEIKKSLSASQPYRKMVVRMPKEIITMRHPMIRPESGRAAAIDPVKLKEWLERGHDDDGREVVLIDTRNNYEVAMGKFEGALDFDLENFGQFPDAIRNLMQESKSALEDKTVVTYCTGGIRCEKAALFMNELNIPRVYQLHGGILNFFEAVGGSHWAGECFVFDERIAVDPELKPTKTTTVPDGCFRTPQG